MSERKISFSNHLPRGPVKIFRYLGIFKDYSEKPYQCPVCGGEEWKLMNEALEDWSRDVYKIKKGGILLHCTKCYWDREIAPLKKVTRYEEVKSLIRCNKKDLWQEVKGTWLSFPL